MSQASNIRAVSDSGNVLTIEGTIEKNGHKVALLHVWLAQPGVGDEKGAGLAFDGTKDPTVQSRNEAFKLTVDPAKSEGAIIGEFFPGPATASVIAVLTDDTDAVTEVLQWSLLIDLTLKESGSGAPVVLTTRRQTS
jgi:hypothetical protein